MKSIAYAILAVGAFAVSVYSEQSDMTAFSCLMAFVGGVVLRALWDEKSA